MRKLKMNESKAETVLTKGNLGTTIAYNIACNFFALST